MSDPAFQYLDVRDERIEMAWFGQANSPWPTLVFLHEGLGCAEMWRDFPRELAETTPSRSLVYSRAGYGRSSPVPVGPRSIRYLYDEAETQLPALLDALAIDQCILVGHSPHRDQREKTSQAMRQFILDSRSPHPPNQSSAPAHPT